MTSSVNAPNSLLQQIELRSTELNSELGKGTRLGTSGGLWLARQLEESRNQYHEILRVLSLANAGITSEGLIAVLEALYPSTIRYGPNLASPASYHHLQTLILKGNTIGVRGVKALAQVLLQDVKLQHLDLYDNSIGNQGIRPLLEALRVNRSLKTLNLWYNSLNTELASSIGSLVKYNSGILKLALGGNDLGDSVCSAIRTALQTNVTIMEIDMSGNTMSQASIDALSVHLKNNAKRRKILRHMAESGWDHCHIPLPSDASSLHQNRRNSSTEQLDPQALSPEEARNGTFVFRLPSRLLSATPSLSACATSSSLGFTGYGNSTSSPDDSFTDSPSSTSHANSVPSYSSYLTSRSTPDANSNTSEQWPAFMPATALLTHFLSQRIDVITRLCLTGNHLSQLPPEILELERLTHLDLRSNCLTALNPEISRVTGLKSLLLAHNQLDSLPDTLVLLNQLEVWALHSNPFSLIPKIYLESSIFADLPQKSALWRYLSSIRLGGSQDLKLQKAKVMIVGDANVGKTSLLHCLQTDFGSFITRWSHRLPKPLATDGIDIEAVKIKSASLGSLNAREKTSSVAIAVSTIPYHVGSLSASSLPSSPTNSDRFETSARSASFTSPPSPSLLTPGNGSTQASGSSSPSSQAASAINYDVWDFAGQDVYYTTHSFFLTPNTVYLVVFDLSRNDDSQMTRIDYWIQSIQTRAGTSLSYILLVGTHADNSSPHAPKLLEKLMRRWVVSRDALAVCTVSCKTGQGIEALKATLNDTATKFGLASQVYPKSWLQVGEVLKALMKTQPWISYEKLSDISRQFYINRSTLALGVLPALKDLGIVLHFSPDAQLQDTVFINPQFIIKAFADVLTIKHRGFIKSDGILHTKDLHHLWQDERRLFSDSSLVKLFELFDVAIRLDGGRLLVPALLQDDVPANLSYYWPHGVGELADLAAQPIRVFYRRNYKFKFLPFGFFSKLMAQCYRNMNWDVTCRWRGGIVCRSRDGEVALATFDENSFLLQLRIDGKRYSTVLTHLILLVDTLIKGWYANAQCSVSIPIPVEGQQQFYYVPREEVIDAIRLSSEIRAIISIPSTGNGDEKSAEKPVSHRVDLVAPDLALSGLTQLTIQELDQDLIRGEIIGKGGQGRVYVGTFRGRNVAIKDFEVTVVSHQEDFDTQQEWLNHQRDAVQRAQLTLQHETLILKTVRHPNIVQIVGFNIHRLVVLLEFISFGHLESYINQTHNTTDAAGADAAKKPSELSRNALLQLRVAIDIASAMSYLHQLKPAILHRDLSANNIMLESLDVKAPVVAKLVDFGTASFVGKSGLGSYHNEKRYCLSPEVLQGRDHTHKADVYSFGILLWQMWSGLFHHELSPNDVMRGLRPSTKTCGPAWAQVPENTQKPIVDLIERMWDTVPSLRPEFSEVVTVLTSVASELGLDPDLSKEYINRLELGTHLMDEEEMSRESFHSSESASHATHIVDWQENVIFSIDDDASSQQRFQYAANGLIDHSLSGITSVTLNCDASCILIGGSDGNLRIIEYTANFKVSSTQPLEFRTLSVSEDPITGILSMSPDLAVCLSSTTLSVIDVQKGAILEFCNFLAGTALQYVSDNSFLIGTSIGTLNLWRMHPLEKITSTQTQEVEKVVTFLNTSSTSIGTRTKSDPKSALIDSKSVAVTETSLYTLNMNSELEASLLSRICLGSHHPITSACYAQGHIWVGQRDGSIHTLQPDPTSVYIVSETFKLHSKPVRFIGPAIEADDNGRMMSVGEDAILFWNPDSLQFVEKPIRFGARAPVAHVIIESDSSILTVSKGEGTLTRWMRRVPSKHPFD